MALSFDGNSGNPQIIPGGGGNVDLALTTGTSNGIIVVAGFGSSGNFPNTPTASGLTFTLRDQESNGSETVIYWTAPYTTSFSGNINISQSGSDFMSACAFAVGDGDQSTIWDSNASLPAAGPSFGEGGTFSTSNADDFVFIIGVPSDGGGGATYSMSDSTTVTTMQTGNFACSAAFIASATRSSVNFINDTNVFRVSVTDAIIQGGGGGGGLPPGVASDLSGFVPRSRLGPLVFGLNPNLFRNPVPNNQFDYPRTMRTRRSPFDLSVPLNPNIQRNNFPVFNGDQSFARRVPDWLPPQPPQYIHRFPTVKPTFNGDQAFSRRVPDWLPAPPPPTNINLFRNPYPTFNGDQSSSKRIPDWLPSPVPPLNPNIFRNLVPFFNGDQSFSKRIPGWLPPPPQPYNQNLYTVVVVTMPFNQYDYPLTDRIPRQSVPTEPLNINLFTNPFPFNQFDWSKPVRLKALPLTSAPLNPNINSNPLPFNQFDYNRPFAVGSTSRQPSVGLNINLFTNQVPILNIEYPLAKRLPQQPQTPATLNINIFTNPLPILNIDTKGAQRAPRVLDIPQPYNQNIHSIIVVTAPFFQTDWRPVRKPPTTEAPEQVFNPNLFRNAFPFNQYSFPQVRDVRQAPFDLSVSTNVNLFRNPIPILNIHYVPVKKPPPAPYDFSQGTLISFIPPPPVGEATYRLLVKHYLGGVYYEAGTIVHEGVEVPIGWVPTIATEPLNAAAIVSYWNAGPPGAVERSQDFYPFVSQYISVFRRQTGPRPLPGVYWQQVPGTASTYILTGDGASLGPKTNG